MSNDPRGVGQESPCDASVNESWAERPAPHPRRQPGETPCVLLRPLPDDGHKYKVNLFVLMTGLPKHGGGGGAWMGGHEGFAYLLVDSAYLRVDPPSSATSRPAWPRSTSS